MLANRGLHLQNFSQIAGGFGGQAAMARNASEFTAGQYEESGDKDGFGDLAVLVGRGLERLSRRIGEAIQVQAIVPIGAANKRQAVGAKTVERVAKAALEVLVERFFRARRIIVRHEFIEDVPVAALL